MVESLPFTDTNKVIFLNYMLLEKLFRYSCEQEGLLHSSDNKKDKTLYFSLVLDWIQHLCESKKRTNKSNKQVIISFDIPRINTY